MGYGQYSYSTFEPRSLSDRKWYIPGGVPQDRTTGKRVKGVFSVSQCIHVWAQRTQTYGQNGKGNLYFRGDRLFDYGDHFCLGQFITNAEGELACLLNSDSYSPTTSSHQREVLLAVPTSIRKFTIPGAGYDCGSDTIDVEKVLRGYEDRAARHAAKAKRCRSESSINHEATKAVSLMREAAAFATFFGHAYDALDMDSLVAALEQTAKAARVARAKRDAKQRETDSDAFAKWQAGGTGSCPESWQLDDQGGVRMRIKNDILQTARGAEVPLAHAVKVFKFVKLCRTAKKKWERNGHTIRVGVFQVDKVTAEGDMTAGCHFFSWESIEATAKAAGVADEEPSAEIEETNV